MFVKHRWGGGGDYMFMSSKNKPKTFLAIALSISASILLVSGIVYATTIGTNISTGGSLTVSGNATFSGLGTDMLASINSSGQLVATSTPTAGFYNATSTTATSTFAGGLSVASSHFQVLQGGGFLNSNGDLNGIGTTNPTDFITIVPSTTYHCPQSNGYECARGITIASYTANSTEGDLQISDYGRTPSDGSTNYAAQIFLGGSKGQDLYVIPGKRISGTLGILGLGDTTNTGSIKVNASTGFFVQTGNVGIGASSASNKLSVTGSADISVSLGIGSTTPSTEISATGSATTTIYLNTSTAAKGTCVQLTQPVTGNPYRLYINTGGTLTTEAGSCK